MWLSEWVDQGGLVGMPFSCHQLGRLKRDALLSCKGVLTSAKAFWLRTISEDGAYWSARIHRTILAMNCLRNLPTRTPANFTSSPSSAASYQPVQKVLHIFRLTSSEIHYCLCTLVHMCMQLLRCEYLGFACRLIQPSHIYQHMTPVEAGRIKVTTTIGGSSLVKDVCCQGRRAHPELSDAYVVVLQSSQQKAQVF